MTNEEVRDRLDIIITKHEIDDENVTITNEKDYDAMRVAIKALEQQTCEDVVSREAVKDKLLKLCNELEGIFADIRMKEVDDCVCGLCEYDCDHGIDGSAFECPGFETDECFKLADEIRYEWQNTKDLPPVNPQYTEDEIQKMQELEQAEIQKAYEIGKAEKLNKWIPVKWHEITDEEREREGYPKEWACHLDSIMPYDGQRILITTKGGYVELDECYSDDGCTFSLDSGYDWVDDVVAWCELPEPYKAESEGRDADSN